MPHAIRLLLCLLAVTVASGADTLKAGDVLPTFSAKDQHGGDFQLKSGTRLLLVSFDMSTGKKANTYLAAKGADYLEKLNAVYLSNIHGMPAVGRMFALPKMRKYPHRIVLADSKDLLSNYPSQNDRITIFALDPELKISAIHFWDPTTDLPTDLAK